MPIVGRAFGFFLQNSSFHVRGSCWRRVGPANRCNLPVKKRNFVETEVSPNQVAGREFTTANVTLNPDNQTENNANQNGCTNRDPILDFAIFLCS